jgi:hypothetical protein
LKNLNLNGDEITVKLPWHPAGEVKLSEYEEMVTYFVQNYIEKYNNA